MKRAMTCFVGLTVALLTTLVLSGRASAGMHIYHDAAPFHSAAGSLETETFESLTVGLWAYAIGLDAFTMTTDSAVSWELRVVAATSLGNPTPVTGNAVEWLTGDGGTLTFAFAHAVTAVGMDIFDAANNGNAITYSTDTGRVGGALIGGQSGITVFLGFVDTDPFNSLTLHDWFQGDGMAFDNILTTHIQAVPVPGAALLGAIGLSVAGWRLKRQTV